MRYNEEEYRNIKDFVFHRNIVAKSFEVHVLDTLGGLYDTT